MNNKALARAQRIHWLDICRGIGILLVIYGHFLSADSYRYVIYAFHMPLFFFLSGVAYHHKKYSSLLLFLKKNVRNIIIPYLLFAVLTYVFWILVQKNPDYSDHEIVRQLKGIFYGNSAEKYLGFNVALWFLPCLFLTKVIFAALTKLSLNKKYIFFSLLSLSVLGYALSAFFPAVKMILGAETAITATVFFGAGFLWNQSDRANKVIQKYSTAIALVCIGLTIVFAVANYNIHGTQVDMRLNRLNNYFLFYAGSLSGIIGSIAISKIIKRNNLVEYIGKHSLILLVWHYIVYLYLSRILYMFFTPSATNFTKLLFPIIYTVFSVATILSIDLMVNKLKANPKK